MNAVLVDVSEALVSCSDVSSVVPSFGQIPICLPDRKVTIEAPDYSPGQFRGGSVLLASVIRLGHRRPSGKRIAFFTEANRR